MHCESRLGFWVNEKQNASAPKYCATEQRICPAVYPHKGLIIRKKVYMTFLSVWLCDDIRPWCRILFSIGSGNGLSPGRRQAIIWINADISHCIKLLGTNLGDFINQNTHMFIQDNAFENPICKMSSILFRHQFIYQRIHSRWGHGVLMKSSALVQVMSIRCYTL